MKQFQMQEEQYIFPYHYIPHIDRKGMVNRYRLVSRGYEYLCYMLHIKEIIDDISPKSILDVGCGDGRLISLLTEYDEISYTGVDISSKAISFAKAFNPNVEFINIDVKKIERKYDLVSLIEVMEHIPDLIIEEFMDDVISKIKIGGYLIISVPSINIPLQKKHYRHYDINTLIKDIKPEENGLTVLSIEYIFNGSNLIYKYWHKLTSNRYSVIIVPILEQIFWNFIWKRLRIARNNNGKHIVALLRKNEEI